MKKIIGKIVLALVLAVSIVSPTPPKAQAQLGGGGGVNCYQQYQQCTSWCSYVYGPVDPVGLAGCYNGCHNELVWCRASGGN